MTNLVSPAAHTGEVRSIVTDALNTMVISAGQDGLVKVCAMQHGPHVQVLVNVFQVRM